MYQPEKHGRRLGNAKHLKKKGKNHRSFVSTRIRALRETILRVIALLKISLRLCSPLPTLFAFISFLLHLRIFIFAVAHLRTADRASHKYTYFIYMFLLS